MHTDLSNIPSARQLYDLLMVQIDEDLTSWNIPSLDDTYANESEQDRAARLQRYQESFARFDAAAKAWLQDLQRDVTEFCHSSLKSAETKSRSEEAAELSTLESTFFSAA